MTRPCTYVPLPPINLVRFDSTQSMSCFAMQLSLSAGRWVTDFSREELVGGGGGGEVQLADASRGGGPGIPLAGRP